MSRNHICFCTSPPTSLDELQADVRRIPPPMTKTKLDWFIASFTNEDALRKAMLMLLEKMPGVRNVRHTHGREERGKDIVFNCLGPFGNQQLVACVIKNEQITGAADSDQGARAVYIQAEQALDTPIANVATGFDERVTQVFVISPYECPPQRWNP